MHSVSVFCLIDTSYLNSGIFFLSACKMTLNQWTLVRNLTFLPILVLTRAELKWFNSLRKDWKTVNSEVCELTQREEGLAVNCEHFKTRKSVNLIFYTTVNWTWKFWSKWSLKKLLLATGIYVNIRQRHKHLDLHLCEASCKHSALAPSLSASAYYSGPLISQLKKCK